MCTISDQMFTIPNILTISNLFFGCCAIVSIGKGQFEWSLYFVLLAALVDFLDGFVARLLKMESNLGAQLDSLSDVVSFGVVPALFCFVIAESFQLEYLVYTTFFMAMMAAFRLARFNVSSSGEDLYFTGLPVPANALFFTGLFYLYQSDSPIKEYVFQPVLFFGILFLFSYLMISHLPILKIHLTKAWLNKYGIILAIEILILIGWFWIGALALSLLIIFHIVSSILMYTITNKNRDI